MDTDGTSKPVKGRPHATDADWDPGWKTCGEAPGLRCSAAARRQHKRQVIAWVCPRPGLDLPGSGFGRSSGKGVESSASFQRFGGAGVLGRAGASPTLVCTLPGWPVFSRRGDPRLCDRARGMPRCAQRQKVARTRLPDERQDRAASQHRHVSHPRHEGAGACSVDGVRVVGAHHLRSVF